ncbi:MAG: hypothetical protein ACI97B_002067 [Verrucomicrobiales bacterium]|jgi:hypothetical protein
MSSYVNLLSENEIHYHSAARDSNLVRYLVIGGIGAAILLGLVTIIRYNSLKKEATSLATRWKTLEGEFESTLAKKKAMNNRETMLNELKGWPGSRVDMAELMEALRDRIPEKIQITRMTILGYIAGVEDAGRSRSAGGRGVTEPERIYSLRIEGTVVDEFGEQIVLDFNTLLENDPDLKKYFSKVVFGGIKQTYAKDHATGAQTNAGNFSIDIQFNPRKVKWTGTN